MLVSPFHGCVHVYMHMHLNCLIGETILFFFTRYLVAGETLTPVDI